MPQNNQVLQKREGYSQIFSAYSMIDLALRLDWSGHDDVYEGEITISLQEGKKSRQSFVIERLHTKINLYYNRTFIICWRS